MMITLYGIANCDKIRIARRWLQQNGYSYEFVDFKQIPLQAKWVQKWLAQVPVDHLINKRSTTWRQLNEEARQQILQGDIKTIIAHPTVIKRPLWDIDDEIIVGETRPKRLES